jgi:hypothetical protein
MQWQQPDPLAQVPKATAPGQAGFVEDVRWAIGVCGRHPALPLVSLLIGLAPLVTDARGSSTAQDGVATSPAPSSGGQALALVVVLVALALVGFPGTQRLWFLRAATGRRVAVREVLPLTFRYFGRFFVLGLTFFALALVFVIPAFVEFARGIEVRPDGTADVPTPSGGLLAIAMAGTVVLDVLFTFVTPALVLTSHRVSDALRIGLRLLRATWPMAAAYVFLPPFAAVVLSLYTGLDPVVSIPLVAASTLVNLLVKGATVAYYLRLVPPAGEDGALVVERAWGEGRHSYYPPPVRDP